MTVDNLLLCLLRVRAQVGWTTIKKCCFTCKPYRSRLAFTRLALLKSVLRCSCFRLCLRMQCVGQCECRSFKYINVRNQRGNLLFRQPMQLRNLFSQEASGSSIRPTVAGIVVIVKSQMDINCFISSRKLLLLSYSSFLSSCVKLYLSMQCVGQCECQSFKYINVRNLRGNLLFRQPMQLRNLFSQEISGSSIRLTVAAIHAQALLQ